jgi:hypothetical protein
VTNVNSTLTESNVTHEHIHFGGTGDNLQFILSSDDTIIATGRNQTIAMIDSPNLTIVDHSRGLTIDPLYGGFQLTVRDFQHDPTGQVHVVGIIRSYTPDGHGGTLLSWIGPTAGGSIDFVGYGDAAKLATHVSHP